MNRRISIIVMNRDAEDRLLKLLPNQGEADAGEPPASGGDVAATRRSGSAD